jgi:tetratricopeptide (TPR) repeat protein
MREKEFNMKPRGRRFICNLLPSCLLSLLLLGGSLSFAQTAPPAATPIADPDRKAAFDIYKEGKMVQAMPLLENLSAKYPKDLAVWEAWGVSVLGYSQTLADPESRRKARVSARTILVKAKDMGDNSNLLQTMLGMLPEDGGNVTFSSRTEINEIMQTAEADFSRGDLDKARDGYIHASLLDPNLYEAPLFTGDVLYKQHNPGSAGEWFARAIQIDPNRETAYRYWGDALVSRGDMEGAREQFIKAVIADPYGRNAWMGLRQWADHVKVTLNWVRLQDKSAVTQKDDTHINITLDPGSGKDDPAGAGWAAYAITRAAWRGDKFKKEFPNEPQYRRTMREEADALHLMVTVLARPENANKRDPSLAALVKIDQAGLIEPFALLNRADKDIAQDYAPYRAAHREVLYRYFDEFVVPKAPTPPPQ